MTEEICKSYDKAITNLRDIYFYLPYIPQKDYKQLEDIGGELEKYRDNLTRKIPIVLISLKNYTECKCSWERAGELSDLHRYGLIEYCEDKGVDWRDLRIDEYYGVDSDEDVLKIIESWKKLDPNLEVHPINYTGNSRYLKYPILQSQTVIEDYHTTSKEQYCLHKSTFLLSEWILNFHDLIQKEKTKGKIINVNKESMDKINKILQGLNITTEEELDTLKNILDEATNQLSDKKFDETLTHLITQFQDNYYDYTLK